MRIGRALLAALVFPWAAPSARADGCPAPLAEAKRLILVVTRSFDATDATLSTYERTSRSSPWRARQGAKPAVVGQRGLGWGFPYRASAAPGEPVKVEGDKRAPAGFYRLGSTFGFDSASRPDHIRLETDTHFCVDDVRSPHYGRIVNRSEAGANTSGEAMREIDLYRRGIVVDYPTDRGEKAGSCIFLHIWRGAGQGTAGCVALAEPGVAELQDWARGETVIALLPETALARFKDCLPAG